MSKVKKEILEKKPKSTLEILHSSESNEWYTPEYFVAAARKLMGNIDLDPASCVEANETVKADKIYTINDDGLAQVWSGRVFLNPPYGYLNGRRGISSAGHWSHEMLRRYRAGEVEEAVIIVNASVGDVWWRSLMQELPFCLGYKRTKFNTPSAIEKKDRPSKGNCVFYLGKNKERFRDIFETEFEIGAVFYEHVERLSVL